MRCIIANHFFVAKTMIRWLFLTAILCFFVPFGFADEEQDLATANALIAIIESNDTEKQTSQAEDLFASIPAESKLKQLASMAIALNYIREKRFSDALKVLEAIPKDQGSVSDSIRIGSERLKLWLLLETGTREKAEAQFNQVVTMTLALDAANTDLTVNCGMIGGVVGMVCTEGDLSISVSNLERVKEVLLAKTQAENAISKLEEQFAEASQRGQKLQARVELFAGVGGATAAKLNSSAQAEYERTKQEQLKLQDDLKRAKSEKRDLEENRNKWFKKEIAIYAELKRETPNKPRQPNRPRKPSKSPPNWPRGFLEPKEMERAEKEYESEKREYESSELKYHHSLEQYAMDMHIYSAWQRLDIARRAPLHAELHRVKLEDAAAKKTLKDMDNEINQVEFDLKQNTNKQEDLKRSALISSIAFEHVMSNDSKTKRLLRPSNFNLLDYQLESTQLRKSLRELQ